MKSEDFKSFLRKYKLSKPQAMYLFKFQKTTYHKYISSKFNEEISDSIALVCDCLEHMGKGKAYRFIKEKLSTHPDKAVRKLKK